ncbi:zinc finger protein 37 homolog [Megalops cyprinoides]|uniref:zinc finger protein 37 homolog n=1 Tax=Megalops cyprinoides TaxID=118141 RepID=UPI001863D0B7|nr:zinc finger protein 37 homolog [Megalops cyprinoides]
MSEQDFQSQLAAIMEILVKAAVRETTKLYETGVLELRIEIAQIKQENETLKSRLQSSENAWRVREGEESTKDDSLNEKYFPTAASQEVGKSCSHTWLFEGPSCQDNEEKEEEDVTVANPISSFKEESPEVEFILIKQEDSDIEEYTPEISPLEGERRKAAGRDLLRGTYENSLLVGAVGSATFPDIVETAPTGIQPGLGKDRSTRAPRGGQSTCITEPGSKRLPQKPHQSRISYSSTKASEDRVEGVRLQGIAYAEENSLREAGKPPSPWPVEQNPSVKSSHIKVQPVRFTEEEAGCTSHTAQLLKSHYPNGGFTPLPHLGHDARPQVTYSLEPTAEADAIRLGQDADHMGVGEERDRLGHLPQYLLDSWSPGSLKPMNTLPKNKQQQQQQGFPFQCGQCGKVLSSATALEAHQSLHTGERPYSCTKCGKAFPSLRGLNRHSQVHSGERQHHCHQCGKSFVYQFSLTKHQLIHSGERAHACKHCGKSFVFKSDLTIHTRMHTGETPYGCSICGKEFKHRRALNMHLQGHSGERRHHCTYCGKSFLDLGNFKRHKRIHTGEKPYSCQLCGKKFTQSAHLKKHFLTHK